MNTRSTTETDQAIKQLTDQIAQLSINLAQRTPPQPTPANYTDTSNSELTRNRPDRHCHYCRRPGHFIAKCRTRRTDQSQNRRNYSLRDNRRDNRRDYRDNRWDNHSRSRSRDYDHSRYRPNSQERSRSQDRRPYDNDNRRRASF